MSGYDDPQRDLLTISLQVAVPLHIAEIRGWPAERRQYKAREAAEAVATHGDDILYKSKKAGRTAAAFNELARGLAILAFQPGGVTFARCHWEAPEAAPPQEMRGQYGNTVPPTTQITRLRGRVIDDVQLPTQSEVGYP